ncbi:hypothetical protein R3P38DRAFT_1659026 [Favolaschia claudopus]|uniref:Uncharacterized protein n=1 Tax=Favolaschia claudopus TaxID=2862362 RepID=A0AAW0AF31_9AGAR
MRLHVQGLVPHRRSTSPSLSTRSATTPFTPLNTQYPTHPHHCHYQGRGPLRLGLHPPPRHPQDLPSFPLDQMNPKSSSSSDTQNTIHLTPLPHFPCSSLRRRGRAVSGSRVEAVAIGEGWKEERVVAGLWTLAESNCKPQSHSHIDIVTHGTEWIRCRQRRSLPRRQEGRKVVEEARNRRRRTRVRRWPLSSELPAMVLSIL